MRTTNFFGKIRWQYAIGEIAFIFIGITTAIWFNNWNASLNAKKIEINTLKEVKNALMQDVKDISSNIGGFEFRTSNYDTILFYLDQQLPYDTVIADKFYYLQSFTKFISNVGAYETLKSRGLETIHNDSLRLKISSYYDVHCEWLLENEKIYAHYFRESFMPMVQEHFVLKEDMLYPRNYAEMIKNNRVQQTFAWQLNYEKYMLLTYEYVQKIIKQLVQQLDEEIASLE